MFRYIALVWDPKAAERTSAATHIGKDIHAQLPGWRCVLEATGLKVYILGEPSSASRVHKLEPNVGIVLGTLFTRTPLDDEPSGPDFGGSELDKIIESGGRRLIDGYWGRYVAILKGPREARVRIIRDPTGAMPCYITKHQDIDVVCSHIHDCAALGLVEPHINWDHLATFLWFDHLISSHTGLTGVDQVQAGECITIEAGDRTAAFYWSPDRILSRRVIENRQHAMDELRSVIQHCVSAWASCYGNVLHELSGGLDSTVVLACLSRSSRRPELVCENYYSEDSSGDERSFARLAAKHADVELIETPIRSTDPSTREYVCIYESRDALADVFLT